MYIDELIKRLIAVSSPAIISGEGSITGARLLALSHQFADELQNNGVLPGDVLAVPGTPSIASIALLMAVMHLRAVALPLERTFRDSELLDMAEARFEVGKTSQAGVEVTRRSVQTRNALLRRLRETQHPGLILLTSGSTGTPKAVLHDLDRLLSKYVNAGKPYRTLCFFTLDHIAGVDTAFYCLFSGGGLVIADERTPTGVCKAIEAHDVEVLPTSPTFLNLLLLSGEAERHDLSSLKIITFGSERMPASVLARLREALPGVRLLQKYGTSELGSPSSRSDDLNPLWIRVDSDRFRTRVENGILFVKAETAMLGYLNAPSPFAEDGWFNTGDLVEIRGDYMRVLGRHSDLINVGGQKVYPGEVENVILGMDNVVEATVYGRGNQITGQIVCARVTVATDEEPSRFGVRLRQYCLERMDKYKVPVRVEVSTASQHTDRYKKSRIMSEGHSGC